MVEIMLALAVSSVVVGLALFLFVQAVNSYTDSALLGHLTIQLRRGLDTVERDLNEADAGGVSVYRFADAEFSAQQDALAVPSGRCAGQSFSLDSQYRPKWQGLIVYCPFMAPGGAGQLRRYAVFPPEELSRGYRFPFSFSEINEDFILLADASGRQVEINRRTGAATGGETREPAYRPVSAVIDSFRVDSENGLYCITLRGGAEDRTGNILSRELTSRVLLRGRQNCGGM